MACGVLMSPAPIKCLRARGGGVGRTQPLSKALNFSGLIESGNNPITPRLKEWDEWSKGLQFRGHLGGVAKVLGPSVGEHGALWTERGVKRAVRLGVCVFERNCAHFDDY